MGRIQSSIGIITGVPIEETVNQLISLSAQPRDRLVERTAAIRQRQVAVTDLTASVIALQLAADKLGSADQFSQTNVSSSDSSLLSAVKTGEPTLGNYQFTPLRIASAQQLLSSGFSSRDEALGLSGSFSFRFGGFVDESVELAELNGGAGVRRGTIRITDRDGNSGVIDLTRARTIDDVVEAINLSDDVDVTASVAGDSLKLDDNTSGSGNLRVQDIGIGSTAADLGLDGIDTASASATGDDILSLHTSHSLARLNDGRGVRLLDELDDLSISLADGTNLNVDFGDFSVAAQQASGATTPANGANAELIFTAVANGGDYDDVTVSFVDDAAVTKGSETVVYDEDAKTLTFNIDAGSTDANDIVSALAGDPTASGLFTAVAGGDGSGVIDVADTATTTGGAAVPAPSTPTIGDVLRVLNEADPDKLEARLSASGDGIELEDKTSGGGAFTVTSGAGGSTAEDLGLTGTAVGGVITGDRLRGGLRGVLLSSLNGGAGLELGQIDLTDRSGGAATVDLATAETLEEVVDLLNAAGGVSIAASINEARNGLVIQDTSGGSGNLTIANADATNTADALGLTASVAADEIDGGSLRRQVISENSLLTALNANGEVDDGSFTITDLDGKVASISLAASQPETVGDLLDLINGLGLALDARINDDGDGIALVDNSGGSGEIVVSDAGSGTAAADLGIAGSSTSKDGTQVLETSTTYEIELAAADSLEDIVQRINDLEVGVGAAVFNEGAGVNPFRLSLISGVTGRAGELLIDASQAEFNFQEIARAQDALLQVGGSGVAGAGILAASSNGSFDGVLDGVTLSVNGASDTPIEIAVQSTDESLISNAKLFVDQYNLLFEKLDTYTFFNEVDESTGILFGSAEALRVESSITSLVTGSFFGVGSIRSLAEVGISVNDTGTLSLDEDKLRARLEADPEAVQQFFTDETSGVAAKFHAAVESLAGEGNSLLVNRNNALQAKIDLNNERITFLSERLDANATRCCSSSSTWSRRSRVCRPT